MGHTAHADCVTLLGGEMGKLRQKDLTVVLHVTVTGSRSQEAVRKFGLFPVGRFVSEHCTAAGAARSQSHHRARGIYRS